MLTRPDREVIASYFQADARLRATQFGDFLAAVAAVRAADGPDSARQIAALAVTPLLDYSSLRRLRPYIVHGTPATDPLRIAVLGGPTTSQLVDLLEVCLAGAGIGAQIFNGGYGAFRWTALAGESPLDDFNPQVVFFATSGRDIGRYPQITDGPEAVAAMVGEELSDWQALWHAVNSRWGATVVQNMFDTPPWDVLGHFASRHPSARTRYVDQLNCALADEAPPHVVLHDVRLLVSELGATRWFDPRWYLQTRMPCGSECLVPYAHSVMAIVRAIAGKSKKVLVLDLDDTLWGGTVGDLGAGGIVFGEGSAPGEAFAAFQQYAKSLRERGVLLAVCSKNDEHRAREPFEQRADMVLSLPDFACFVANWRNKADNLREIAERLDVGCDSLVFVDDNPAERALVRHLLPAVAVPDIPDDPAGYIGAVAIHRYFETSSFTVEDSRRGDYYAQNARRKELAARAGDLDAFLSSLEMVARVEPVGPLNLPRVAQLVAKSNQFNLTARRYTAAEIQQIASDPNWVTLTISLRDRLGESGLISVILGKRVEGRLDIDTWLMSCRVLHRGVEQLALRVLLTRATALGCSAVRGEYRPTDRNTMVRDHYARLGFVPAGRAGASTLWMLAVEHRCLVEPGHIRLEDVLTDSVEPA